MRLAPRPAMRAAWAGASSQGMPPEMPVPPRSSMFKLARRYVIQPMRRRCCSIQAGANHRKRSRLKQSLPSGEAAGSRKADHPACRARSARSGMATIHRNRIKMNSVNRLTSRVGCPSVILAGKPVETLQYAMPGRGATRPKHLKSCFVVYSCGKSTKPHSNRTLAECNSIGEGGAARFYGPGVAVYTIDGKRRTVFPLACTSGSNGPYRRILPHTMTSPKPIRTML